jgi:hypothetical protein
MALLDKAKVALRITVEDYDEQITDLIEAAKLDLGIAGVVLPEELDALCSQAIITYCRVHFGSPEPEEYDRLKRAYDEQKAQLQTATGYTDWGEEDDEA